MSEKLTLEFIENYISSEKFESDGRYSHLRYQLNNGLQLYCCIIEDHMPVQDFELIAFDEEIIITTKEELVKIAKMSIDEIVEMIIENVEYEYSDEDRLILKENLMEI